MIPAHLSPQPTYPTQFSRRRFSFAIELYRALYRSHAALVRLFCLAFPNPLSISWIAQRRARVEGGQVRGDGVVRQGTAGRLIGRHPMTGAPVIAWNEESFAAMCESFDAENAARIVAWQKSSERIAFSTERCARVALRMDRWLHRMVAGCTLAGSGIGALLAVKNGTAVLSAVAWGGAGGLAVGVTLLLLVAIAMLTAVYGLGMAVGLGVGVWARRQHVSATVTDEAGRLSAGAIVAAMQGKAPEAVCLEGEGRSVLIAQRRRGTKA